MTPATSPDAASPPPPDAASPPVPPPLLTATDLPAVLDAVAAEGHGHDLAGARLHDEGYENLVLRTADGWILRFPRREEPDFGREVALLRRLAGRLTVPVPEVAWTGVHHRLMAYRALDGASFDPVAYAAADPRSRDRLATSLARFLAVMHTALTAPEIADLRIPVVDHDAQAALARDRIDRVPAGLRSRAEDVVEHFAEAWLEPPRPARQVLLHNDFHLLNVVLTDGVGELAGVWDFSCVQVGSPSLDLRYFVRVPDVARAQVRRDLLQRVADQYARTGITLDVDAARAAIALEDLVDAIDSGDFAGFARLWA